MYEIIYFIVFKTAIKTILKFKQIKYRNLKTWGKWFGNFWSKNISERVLTREIKTCECEVERKK